MRREGRAISWPIFHDNKCHKLVVTFNENCHHSFLKMINDFINRQVPQLLGHVTNWFHDHISISYPFLIVVIRDRCLSNECCLVSLQLLPGSAKSILSDFQALLKTCSRLIKQFFVNTAQIVNILLDWFIGFEWNTEYATMIAVGSLYGGQGEIKFSFQDIAPKRRLAKTFHEAGERCRSQNGWTDTPEFPLANIVTVRSWTASTKPGPSVFAPWEVEGSKLQNLT